MRKNMGWLMMMVGLMIGNVQASEPKEVTEIVERASHAELPADQPVTVKIVEDGDNWGFRVEGIFVPSGRLGMAMDTAIAEGKKRFNKEPTYVELNSSGGLHQDAKVVAGLIYLARLNTRVLADDSCSSACVLMFMSGRTRSLDPNGAIGIHQNKVVATKEGVSESEAVQNLLFDYFRFAALGNINPHLMGFMAYVPYEDMARLPNECVSYFNLDNVHIPPKEGCSYDSKGLFPILKDRQFGDIPT